MRHFLRRIAGAGRILRGARAGRALPAVQAGAAVPGVVLLALVLPVFVLRGADPAVAQTLPRQRPSIESLESETHALVNRHRRAAGLPALRSDPAIKAVARRHSEAMAAGRVPFGHEGVEDRRRRIERSIPLEAMAENVGVNTWPARRTARATVSGWLGSPGHRANIEGDFDATGIGIARDREGAWYYTQIFVKRARDRLRRPPR